MEEKNELSDILLDKNKNNASKKKKILLLVIALILLFLLVLIGMKIFNKSETKTNKLNMVLPPEPTTVNTKQKDDLFKQVPIVEENTSKENNFNAMVEKLKKKEQKENINTQVAKKNLQPTEENKTIEPIETKILKTTKKIAKKNSKTKQEFFKNNIYIQVGVNYRFKPNKKYLLKIKKLGYHYRLYNTKIGGKKVVKTLIGPYKNRTEAKKALIKIKKNINKAAFMYIIR